MIRKAFALFVALAVLVCAFAITASAANDTNLDVSFELTENDLTPPTVPDPPPYAEPNGTYQVIIPASITLNYTQDIWITTAYYDIADSERLNVYLVCKKDFFRGQIYSDLRGGKHRVRAGRVRYSPGFVF
ncbi:hypothetical protein AGMMS49975_23780 [Clostridia bacterium]|nr:hypothetical protein AGMMS49975_23780 [Clostridia bacterium]